MNKKDQKYNDYDLLESGDWRHEIRAMRQIVIVFLFSTEGTWTVGIAIGFLSFCLRHYLSH